MSTDLAVETKLTLIGGEEGVETRECQSLMADSGAAQCAPGVATSEWRPGPGEYARPSPATVERERAVEGGGFTREGRKGKGTRTPGGLAEGPAEERRPPGRGREGGGVGTGGGRRVKRKGINNRTPILSLQKAGK